MLVVLGLDDPNAAVVDWLASVEAGLAASGSEDALACLVPGRTRHAFTDAGVSAILEWLSSRTMQPDAPGRADSPSIDSNPTSRPRSGVGRPAACLESIPGH